jgi:protein-tyrosine phosphatase
MKHAVLLVLLGLALTTMGVAQGGWFLISVWFGMNFLLVGLAHFGKWHRILGKRSDGTLPLWSWLVFGPLLLYTSAVWHLLRLLNREPAQNTVTTDLVVGRRLLPSETQEHFENYVDLTAEFVELARIRNSEGYICFPILDGSAPDPGALRDALKELRPGKTFIHCAQGHGRTGLFACALLLASGKARSVDEGLSMLQNVRPRVRLSRAQRACLDQFAAMKQAGEHRI